MSDTNPYVWYALCGAAGAFIRSLLVHKGSVYLWRVTVEDDGRKRLDLGIIASMIIGAVIGAVADSNYFNALAWAIAGPYMIEEWVKRVTGVDIKADIDNEGGDQDV